MVGKILSTLLCSAHISFPQIICTHKIVNISFMKKRKIAKKKVSESGTVFCLFDGATLPESSHEQIEQSND